MPLSMIRERITSKTVTQGSRKLLAKCSASSKTWSKVSAIDAKSSQKMCQKRQELQQKYGGSESPLQLASKAKLRETPNFAIFRVDPKTPAAPQ